MPIVDIIQHPKDWDNLTEEENSWIRTYPGSDIRIRYFENESTERLGRAKLAAETSARAGGAVLPEAKDYPLPPLVTGLDVMKMGKDTWEEMKAAATWAEMFNADACINLDHPDVKAVL
jgi:hypothetical protein